jgi:hypothetical protein
MTVDAGQIFTDSSPPSIGCAGSFFINLSPGMF